MYLTILSKTTLSTALSFTDFQPLARVVSLRHVWYTHCHQKTLTTKRWATVGPTPNSVSQREPVEQRLEGGPRQSGGAGPRFLPILCVREDNPGLRTESPMIYVGAGRPAGGNGRCGGDCLCYVSVGRRFGLEKFEFKRLETALLSTL